MRDQQLWTPVQSVAEVHIMLKTCAFSTLLAISLAASGCARTDTLTTSSQTAGPGEEWTAAAMAKGGRPASGGTVFVTSQGLHFDTFVARDPLPMNGRFQQLVNGTTEFGPGDPGYLGGRWWEDTNGDGIQDAGDHYFLCPLLPPGRPTP